ncbi:helix-turn-helix domain-containing protein [Bradyrhizobium sediminis]|uniref:Helix-turn-helix domain-containing protein n=1 Tax=Bradyrhizobium sediminis TaxID=2840469 RepID=A0A975NIR0_9BRAD|nr:helix-turn-helix domain-containing protein [Bradyrhizobium sediminis]QWG15281.1 helix-turn-helix domain-containing protein [Bradyrhizobium sediminis]
MPVLFDSKTIAARDNFPLWQEFIASAFFGMKAEPIGVDPFVAQVELSNVSGIDIATARFPAQRLYRSKAEIAHIAQDAYCVALVESGLSQGTHGGVSFTARPGDLVIIDVSKPFDLSVLGEGTKLSVIQIDKQQLAQRLGEPRLVPVTASTGSGAEALLASYIGGLAQSAATLPAASAGRAASIACDLFAIAFSQRATADLGAESVHDARLAAALTFIARNITDVWLDAKRVACHLGISPRSVYGLFERSGLSLAETILSQRLEACRAALIDPTYARRTIADLALDLGFNDLSRFNRHYRARYGETPRETRTRMSGCERST